MWSKGESALLRFIRYDQVRRATAAVVVEDSDGLVALHVPVGAPAKVAVWEGSPIRGQADRTWALRDHVWDSFRALKLINWDEAHSLELFWHAETDDFAGWYVNLQEPLRRSPVGFDTDDLVLDIWIEAGGTWRWKDEDELEEAVRLGRFTLTEADEIRNEGERVLAARPWPTGWEDWHPDSSWTVPALPNGWDAV
jgi:Protein of unknown function (DUF402)